MAEQVWALDRAHTIKRKNSGRQLVTFEDGAQILIRGGLKAGGEHNYWYVEDAMGFDLPFGPNASFKNRVQLLKNCY